jgi:glycosyltransferase involved in cell wall biosynthesis
VAVLSFDPDMHKPLKIVMIVPGSGGTFYCENCLRDTALIQALRKRGHEVVMVPMYLPFFTDEPGVAGETPVFFGGINVYLQEKCVLYRYAPRWLSRWFDAPWLLERLAKYSGSTKAFGMGRMTLSMLQGMDGHHATELERMVEWLLRDGRPDVIQISTALLIGLARQLREKLGTPVVCLLQDEDTWVDALEPPYPALCWNAIRDGAKEADKLVAVSDYYARFFSQRAGLPRERMAVVHPGIDPTGYGRPEDAPDAKERVAAPPPPTIGYLSQMTESLGLGTLVEAFMLLKAKPGLETLRLRAMGGLNGPDKAFVSGLKAKLAAKGMVDSVEFLPELDRASRIRFLQSLTVMSVPIPGGAAFGTFLLESLAAGVPVVQPNCGAFPELIQATGGGLCYEPQTGQALAEALETLLRDPPRAAELGRQGRAAVLARFTVEAMADKMMEVYGQ